MVLEATLILTSFNYVVFVADFTGQNSIYFLNSLNMRYNQSINQTFIQFTTESIQQFTAVYKYIHLFLSPSAKQKHNA